MKSIFVKKMFSLFNLIFHIFVGGDVAVLTLINTKYVPNACLKCSCKHQDPL